MVGKGRKADIPGEMARRRAPTLAASPTVRHQKSVKKA